VSAPKNTTLHCRCSLADLEAWVAEAKRMARAKGWSEAQQERPLTRWVTETLNAAVKGGAKRWLRSRSLITE